MGSIVAQDPAVVLPGEPDAPSAYWLAALDVFETGENLPSRVGGGGFEAAEDWRMAIVWGRTLVALADEKVTCEMNAAKAQSQSYSQSASSLAPTPNGLPAPAPSPFAMSEPQWPAGSPFRAIAQARPPVTRRMSLYAASAHEVMVLAMDQFSRGIFHMPHAHYSHVHNPSFVHVEPVVVPAHAHSPSVAPSVATSSADPLASFSRPKELFTIASEVLGVAERLRAPAHRHYWAAWADGVFNQMKNEADVPAWRRPILSARGRCWLVMGSAGVEDVEAALESESGEVLHSAEAEEAREGLAMAVSFFERARGGGGVGAGAGAGAGGEEAEQEDAEDVRPLLAEALLVLANLTADAGRREALYARAQAEVDEDLGLGLRDPVDASAGVNVGAGAGGEEPRARDEDEDLGGDEDAEGETDVEGEGDEAMDVS